MALTFEYEKDIETGTQPFICHEPDSTLYSYYIVDESALDKSAIASGGSYDSVIFDDEDRHLTTQAVSGIGIKNFPGIGGIGFYKDLYSDNCSIAAPIHVQRNSIRDKIPVLNTVEVDGNMLHIVITPPEDLQYTCYRVVVRQEAFAFEYITYKTDCRVDIPTVQGDYKCFCIGYDETTGVVSATSNVVPLYVPYGASDWRPYITDVDELTRHIEQTDAAVEDLDTRVTYIETAGGSAAASLVYNGASVVQADESFYEQVLTSDITKEE